MSLCLNQSGKPHSFYLMSSCNLWSLFYSGFWFVEIGGIFFCSIISVPQAITSIYQKVNLKISARHVAWSILHVWGMDLLWWYLQPNPVNNDIVHKAHNPIFMNYITFMWVSAHDLPDLSSWHFYECFVFWKTSSFSCIIWLNVLFVRLIMNTIISVSALGHSSRRGWGAAAEDVIRLCTVNLQLLMPFLLGGSCLILRVVIL